MPLTEGQKQSMYNYAKKNLKRIPLDVQKEKYDEIKTAADSAGESVNGYIKKAIDDRMERDGFSTAANDSQNEPQIEPLAKPTTTGLPSYLTPDILDRIDKKRFLGGDMSYQLEIGSIIGMDNLSPLADYLRQQNKQ